MTVHINVYIELKKWKIEPTVFEKVLLIVSITGTLSLTNTEEGAALSEVQNSEDFKLASLPFQILKFPT